jgi:hypothetical protein
VLSFLSEPTEPRAVVACVRNLIAYLYFPQNLKCSRKNFVPHSEHGGRSVHIEVGFNFVFIALISFRVVAKQDYALVSVVPPNRKTRNPVHICCVIDTSGSMGSEASLKGDNGKTESYGTIY